MEEAERRSTPRPSPPHVGGDMLRRSIRGAPSLSAAFLPFRILRRGAIVRAIFMNEYQLARNLGAFSIGLGLAEILFPRQLARLIGVSEEHDKTLLLLGLREMASGLGIMQGKPAYFLWSRVAGDIMD